VNIWISKEVAGCWRNVYNEELFNLYFSLNVIKVTSRRMRWVGHVAHMGEIRNAYKFSVRKSEGKRPPCGT